MSKSKLNHPLPLCCTPEAFQLMSRQAASIESPDALVFGAAAIAMHQVENVDPATVDETIQRYADTVRSRVRGPQTQALMAHLHDVLFDEEGFTGNEDDYYNTANSYLPEVLRTKRGLPITLSLVYKIVAERLGLRAWGVGLPGHFVAGVDCHGPALVDCFHGGRLLDRGDALQLVHDTAGGEADFDESMLRPVTHRHWVTRLIQNLLQIHSGAGNYTDVAAMLEFELLLWPDQLHLQRDLGLVLARIGQPRPAASWLEKYLKERPDDPQRADLEELLGVLR